MNFWIKHIFIKKKKKGKKENHKIHFYICWYVFFNNILLVKAYARYVPINYRRHIDVHWDYSWAWIQPSRGFRP